jgi:predicted PurR-regulated permease PerM
LILVPADRKELGEHIMNRISLSLKGWLKGMLFSMLLVTILIGVALSIIGVPVALILALITGLLELIPNIGSLIAMIPGVLLALTMGTNTAILVAVVYIASQTIVANIVTPLIQKKMINLPPALTLISQLIMGVVSGALGIILAVPLLAILIILVDELYVKKIAHNDDDEIDKGVLD